MRPEDFALGLGLSAVVFGFAALILAAVSDIAHSDSARHYARLCFIPVVPLFLLCIWVGVSAR